MAIIDDNQMNRLQAAYNATVSQGTSQRQAVPGTGKWWSGDQPTSRDIMGQIGRVMKEDPVVGGNILTMWQAEKSNPRSQYYNVYSRPTNSAVNTLNSYGVDTTNLYDWAMNDRSWQQNLIYNGTTNTPSKPGKKATPAQIQAYYTYQYVKSEEDTRKAESEWAAMQKDLGYWANREDLNYSDDEIIDQIDWSKYPTLAKMKETASLGQPMELNRGLNFTDDNMYGAIWAARNNGGSGDLEADAIMSASGEGKQWEENPEIRAKTDPTSPDYAPYAVSGTLFKEAAYFGVPSFDQKWVDEHAYLKTSDNKTDRDYYNSVVAAEERTRALEEKYDAMKAEIEETISNCDDPDIVLQMLRENPEYSALFDLDNSLKYSEDRLIGTTRPIGYRWVDIETQVRRECEEKQASRMAPFDAVTKTISSVRGDTMKEAFSEAERNVEAAAVANMMAAAPLAFDNLSDKTALETGRTLSYSTLVDSLKNIAGNYADFARSSVQNSTQNITSNYWDNLGITSDYDGHKQTRDQLQRELEETDAEWRSLDNRVGLSDITADEYLRLLELKQDNLGADIGEWVYGTKDSENTDDALLYLYRYVRGIYQFEDLDVPVDEAIEKARSWWNYLSGSQGIDRLVSDANKTDSGVDEEEYEVESKNGGLLTIRLEKNEEGQFEFAGAVDQVTGKAYGADWKDEVNSLITSGEDTEPLSAEDAERWATLREYREEREQKLQEENDWLALNEDTYNTTVANQKELENSWALAATLGKSTGIEVDKTYLPKLEAAYQYGSAKPQWMYLPYSLSDYGVLSKEYTKDQMNAYAAESFNYYQQDLEDMKEILADPNIPMTDEMRANIEGNVRITEWKKTDASYCALDGSEDFSEVASRTRDEAASGKFGDPAYKLANFRNTGNPFDLVTNPMNDSTPFLHISNEEMDRYFYLLGKDGPQAAHDYLDFLTNAEHGVLPIRDSEEGQKLLASASSEGGLGSAMLLGASFFTKMVSAPMALLYRANQQITGKDVVPHGWGFQPMNATETIRTNVKNKLVEDFGGDDSFWGKVASTGFDIGTGFADYALNAKVVNTFLLGLEGTALGKWLNPAIQGNLKFVNSAGYAANRKYLQVLKGTGDEEKASVMAGFTFLTDLVATSVFYGGIGAAYHANPEGFVAKAKDITKRMLTGGGKAALASGVTQAIDDSVDRFVMGDQSEWAKLRDKYINEDHYSTTRAEIAADNDIAQKIFDGSINAGITAALRIGLASGAGMVARTVKPKILDLWDRVKTEAEIVVSKLKGTFTSDVQEVQNDEPFYFNKDTYIGTPYEKVAQNVPNGAILNPINGLNGTMMYDRVTGKGYNVVAYNVTTDNDIEFIADTGERLQFTKVIANPSTVTPDEWYLLQNAADYLQSTYVGKSPVDRATDASKAPRTTPAQDQQLAKDLSILTGADAKDPTSSAVAVTAVLGSGNPDADKAAAQAMTSGNLGGNSSTAVYAVQNILASGHGVTNPDMLKSDLVYAALTNGEANAVLKDLLAKQQTGEPITPTDVIRLQTSLQSDRQRDAQGLQNIFLKMVRDSKVANRFIEKLADPGVQKQLAPETEEVSKAEQNYSEKQEKLNDAQTNAEATAANLSGVTEQFVNDPQNMIPSKEQTTEKVVAAITARDDAQAEADQAKTRLDGAKKKRAKKQQQVSAELHEQAEAEIAQEEQQNTEAAYNNAVAALEPTKAFDHSIEVFDSEGRPVRLTGIWAVTDETTIYTTEDGRLVMENPIEGRRAIRLPGAVSTDETMDTLEAQDWMVDNNAQPRFSPVGYFPSSIPVEINGQTVQMIGVAGKESVDGWDNAVIMGLNGQLYSLADENVSIPFDYQDIVDETYDKYADRLESMQDVPRVQITGGDVNAENAGRQLEVGPDVESVPGTGGEGNNEGQLPPAPGRDDRPGDLSDAGSDGGENLNGGAEESSPESVGQNLRGVSERLLTKETVKKLKAKGATDLHLKAESDPSVFSSNLEEARSTNKHGLYVDGQSPENLLGKGAILITSDNGLAGVAIGTVGSEKGNIFGVYKNGRSRARRASASLIIQAVAQGGNKLDCYDGGLRDLYAAVGFVPVARVPFNPKFAPEGWNYDRDGEPDVVVWMLKPGETAESIAEKYGVPEAEGGYHIPSEEEMAALPVITDYDMAMECRDNILANGGVIPAADAPMLEKLMGAPLSETFTQLMNKWLSGEDLSESEVNALYDTPQLKFVSRHRMEGSSMDPTLLSGFDLNNPGEIKKIEAQLPPEQVAEQRAIKAKLDQQGSAVFDEGGNVSLTGEVDQGHRLDLIVGLASSGKSSIADYISAIHHSRFLDPDQAKELHSLYKNGINEDYIHVESKFINDQRTIEAAKRGDNIIVQLLGEQPESVLKRLAFFKEHGYEIHLHMTDLPKNKALGRAVSRFVKTGRYHDIRHLMKADPEKIAATFDQLKGDESIDGYSRWSTDVPRTEHPIPLESSGPEETDIFGRDLQRGPAVQNPVQKGISGDGDASTTWSDNGRGLGGLTSGPGVGPVNPTITGVPVNGRLGQHQWGREGAQQSQILSPETKAWLLEHNSYLKSTNEEVFNNAVSWLESHATSDDPDGFHKALAEVESEGFSSMNKDGQARIMLLLSLARKYGNPELETRLADIYNNAGTDPAQALQVRKMFAAMSPEGRRLTLQKLPQKIKDEYQAKGKDVGDLTLSDEVLDMAANAKTPEEFEAARRKAELELAAQIPSDWKLRMRTLRMTSMLANLRTHLRNIKGNFYSALMVENKNLLGACMERLVKLGKGQRTKAIRRTPESKAFAERDAEAMKPELQGTAKYYEANAVERNRKAFGTKDTWVSRKIGRRFQQFADWSSDMLEKEDWWFLKYHYKRALSGYMTANGYTEADMKGEVLDKARSYAILEAQKATYRDPNTLAKWLSDAKNKPTWVQFGIDAVQPFVKTPANIMRRGVEYSPVGLVSSVTTAKHQLDKYKEWEDSGFEGPKPKDARSSAEVIDRWAAGLTGTGLAGFGAWLASLGILRTKASDAEKRQNKQDYSLELFGQSVGIGSIIPANIPLFLGASLYEAVEDWENKDGSLLGNVLNTISEIVEPVVDTTMMSSLNSLLDTSKYSSSGNLTLSTLVQKVIANYVSSYMPSFVGAVAKTIDPTRRKAFVGAGDDMSIWSAMLEQTQNKFPFLSTLNAPYIDVWGREENPGHFGAFLQNFILTDKIQSLSNDELDTKLQELYETSGESGVLPKAAEKTVTINKEKIRLNDRQWYQYGKTRGQIAHDTLSELIERPEFVALSGYPEVQAELVKRVYSYAKQKGLLELFPEKEINDSWMKGALTADNVVDYIFEKEEEKAKDASVKSHKESLYKSLENEDMETASTDIKFLRQAGVEDSTIKQNLTNHFKPLYIQAYLNNDGDEMRRIQNLLVNTGLGYEKVKFSNWLKDAKKPGSGGGGGAPGEMPTRPESDDDWGQYMQDLDDYWADYDFASNDPTDWDYGGTIDLDNRQVVHNDDNSISTEYSFSFYDDDIGKEVLIPQVVNGRIVSEEEAKDHYYKTGEHLGMFDDWRDADEYAMMLHNRNNWYYNR